MKQRMVVVILALFISALGLDARGQEQVPTYLTPEEATTDRLIQMLKPGGKEFEIVNCGVCEAPDKASEEEGIGTEIPAIPMAYNSSAPDSEAQHVLQRVADAINSKAVRRCCIRVEGHTDRRGSAAYNEKLSERRARSVVSYLEKLGVQPDHLVAVGYGKTKPICDEDTEECWKKNRAVRFVTLGD
jgi:outer membrane protein OmpA-like peptidoglycan-associated protein